MIVQRINAYEDSRFEPDILRQHGAFVVDGKYPCGFRILDGQTAEVYYHDYADMEEILESFRFYTGHIRPLSRIIQDIPVLLHTSVFGSKTSRPTSRDIQIR